MKGEKEMEKYNEIFRLKDMLDKAEIDYTFNNLYDGYQIKIDYIDIYATDFLKTISIIEHYFSYGNERDMVEFYDFDNDPVEVYACRAFEKIIEHIRPYNLVIEDDEVNYLPEYPFIIYRNSIAKHPERVEQITIDYCNMMLRNDKFTPADVESTFKEAGVTKKYFIDENGLHIM